MSTIIIEFATTVVKKSVVLPWTTCLIIVFADLICWFYGVIVLKYISKAYHMLNLVDERLGLSKCKNCHLKYLITLTYMVYGFMSIVFTTLDYKYGGGFWIVIINYIYISIQFEFIYFSAQVCVVALGVLNNHIISLMEHKRKTVISHFFFMKLRFRLILLFRCMFSYKCATWNIIHQYSIFSEKMARSRLFINLANEDLWLILFLFGN